MIASFACKNIDFADIIKCSFNLNKTEYTLFLFLISSKELKSIKLKAKKYNPATRKHEVFIEKKLPPHSK